jgi:hypothetical protein
MLLVKVTSRAPLADTGETGPIVYLEAADSADERLASAVARRQLRAALSRSA